MGHSLLEFETPIVRSTGRSIRPFAILFSLAAAIALGRDARSSTDALPESVARGISVFSRLAGDGRPLPYPFERLLASLETRTAPDPMVKAAVLVPLGRSLQRAAAGGLPFRFPRLLIAATDGSLDGEPLRDRFFLAYQERAATIEVISWSPASGRFEFEVVEGYSETGSRRVRPAPRELCLACHANAGPLFPAAPWSETQGVESTARRLSAERSEFHGVPTAIDAGAADDYAAAVNRANLLPTWAALWGEGCGALPADEPRACRAAAFVHALRSALAGGAAPSVDGDFAAAVRAAFERRWPMGLPIPDASLPDRDPLANVSDTADVAWAAAATSVPPGLEASVPRPPRDTLHASDAAGIAARFSIGLARGIARADVERLSALLPDSAESREVVLRRAVAEMVDDPAEFSADALPGRESIAALLDRISATRPHQAP